MSHSFNKVWIHAIWSTKERHPFILPALENKIHGFLWHEIKETGCIVRIINGMEDHIHALFLMNMQKSISDVIKHIKGTSSHLINQQNLTKEKFAWQKGYAAYSVSESQLEKVYFYIKNQKKHHSKLSFEEEYNQLVSLHSGGLG